MTEAGATDFRRWLTNSWTSRGVSAVSLIRPSAGMMCTRTTWSYLASVEALVSVARLDGLEPFGHPLRNCLQTCAGGDLRSSRDRPVRPTFRLGVGRQFPLHDPGGSDRSL